MRRLGLRLPLWLAVCCVGGLLAGSAQALTVTTASLGSGRGCTDSACANQTMTLSTSAAGSGTLTLGGGLLTFSITLPSSSFVPISGPDDNGVTQLDFTSVTYTGTATVSTVGIVSTITGGSASISGTQTPTGAGAAGPFAAATSLLSGTCTDLGTSLFCGIIFSPLTDFNFDVNGQVRHWTHTLNLTAVPEPTTALLLATGLVGLAVRRRTVRQP